MRVERDALIRLGERAPDEAEHEFTALWINHHDLPASAAFPEPDGPGAFERLIQRSSRSALSHGLDRQNGQ